MSRSRTVVIAGAGIGGLAAAIALANADFRAVVVERDKSPDTSGAGIQLSPNATRALAALGVLDALRPRAIAPAELVVSNALNGALLAVMPLADTMQKEFGAPYLVCLRSDLHDALAAAAADHPDIELRYGAALTDFVTHSRGVTVQTERNRQIEEIAAPVLIGADGIRSAVRTQLFPGASPRHGGMSAWRALVSADALPEDLQDAPKVRVWLGPGAHLVHYPVGDGSKVNLVAVTMDRTTTQSWGEERTRDEVLPLFSHWGATPRAVLAAAQSFRRWSLFEAPLLPKWGTAGVTLLGDAAHGMFPFIAQGAAAAIEDAVTLAEELRKNPDPAAGLRAYEATRRPRTMKIQSAARNVGRIYHMHKPWSIGRNLVMERIGGAGLLRQNAWIYRG